MLFLFVLEPPFHKDYLQQTWLLDLAKKDCLLSMILKELEMLMKNYGL